MNMKMNFRTLAAFCALSFAMTGCSDKNQTSQQSSSNPLMMNSRGVEQSESQEENSDYENISAASEADCSIIFTDEKISAEGEGVEISDKTVEIRRAGTFALSGSCGDCKIKINAGKEDKVTLLLNGAELSSSEGSVIDCESAKTLVLYTNSETSANSLSDSANYSFDVDQTEPDSAVFTRSDLVIAGNGELTVTGNYNDAVKCKDGITITGGKLNVISADDGIVGKDYVKISGGEIAVNAAGDGIKSTNDKDADKGCVSISGGNVSVISGNDGIQAETRLCVKDGKISVEAGGEDADAEITVSGDPFDWDEKSENSESKKGFKAKTEINIKGGDIRIKSADDSIHSNGDVTVEAGELTLSSCDDGIHADENLTISGGSVMITKSYEGLEGMNIDIGGGTIDIKAADDGINAAGGDNGGHFGYDSSENDYYISVSGGNITVNADGDGIDSNGTIAQSGGEIVVYGPTESMNGAIDYEKSFAVSGGSLIALGSRGMAQAPSTLSQPCLSIYGSVAAGSSIEVRDDEDNVILSTETPKACQSLIFTSDKFSSDSDYGIYVNGELLQTVTAVEGISGGGAEGGSFGPGGGFGGGPGGGPGGGFGGRG